MNMFVLEHGMTLAMECKALQHVVLLAKADKYMHVYFYSYNIIRIYNRGGVVYKIVVRR